MPAILRHGSPIDCLPTAAIAGLSVPRHPAPGAVGDAIGRFRALRPEE